MKKRIVFALVLVLSLALTGCMGQGLIRAPETAADGTPWDGKWVNMAGRLGVEKPEGFDLLTTNGTLEDLTIHYATWVIGEGTEVEKDTYVYDAQIYLMTELCGTAESAEATMAEWYANFETNVTLTERENVTVQGADFELLHYDCGEDAHFSRGVCAVWSYGDMVLVADIACIEGMDLELTEVMTEFLEGFHYA